MRIFNKLRAQSLEKDNLKKYFKYAIGEIILVVIGILIAFQINSYGDQLKQKERISNILQIIKEDLKQDTIEVSKIIDSYEEIHPELKRFFSDSMSDLEIDTSHVLGALIFTYAPFNSSDMGYLLLKKQESIFVNEQRVDLQEIVNFYSEYNEHIEDLSSMVKNEVKLNLRYYVNNYDWFHTMFTAEQSEFKAHIKKSPKFKNKLFTFKLLVYENYVPMLRSYKKGAIEIIERIEKSHE